MGIDFEYRCHIFDWLHIFRLISKKLPLPVFHTAYCSTIQIRPKLVIIIMPGLRVFERPLKMRMVDIGQETYTDTGRD